MPCSGSMHVHTARTTARYSRCNVHRAARCSVYRSQRAAQGYHYGGSRHSLLIAGFQRESRTNERTLAAPFARHHYIFRGEKERAHERRTRPEIRTHTRPAALNTALSFHTGNACQSMGESGHRPVEFLPASLNIPPASIRYFVTDTLTRVGPGRWNWIKQPPERKTGLGGGTRILSLLPEKNRSVFCIRRMISIVEGSVRSDGDFAFENLTRSIGYPATMKSHWRLICDAILRWKVVVFPSFSPCSGDCFTAVFRQIEINQ